MTRKTRTMASASVLTTSLIDTRTNGVVSNGTTDFMTSAQGGAVYIYNDVVGGRGGNGIRFDNLPDTFAEQIDAKLDDGKPDSGNVRATGPYTNNGTIITRLAIFF